MLSSWWKKPREKRCLKIVPADSGQLSIDVHNWIPPTLGIHIWYWPSIHKLVLKNTITYVTSCHEMSVISPVWTEIQPCLVLVDTAQHPSNGDQSSRVRCAHGCCCWLVGFLVLDLEVSVDSCFKLLFVSIEVIDFGNWFQSITVRGRNDYL